MDYSQKEKISKYLEMYKQLGLCIIPCKGKFPLIKSWQEREVPTEEELNQWIANYKDLNIGMVLGSKSGIVGIDLDGEAAKYELKKISNGDLPETWAFITPGGGVRYLYSLPNGVIAKKYKKELPGEHNEIALLGDGQQTILPPSIHPNGGIYKWFKGKDPNSIRLAQVPKWMLDLMISNTISTDKLSPNKKIDYVDGEAVIERLETRCPIFKKALQEQKDDGLSEDDWFIWCDLLVSSNQLDAAYVFSELSIKYDRRSKERISKLGNGLKDKDVPMIRCISYGCDKSQIERCFSKINEDESGTITNSPGYFIKDMTMILPPRNDVYDPYIRALESINDYDIDEEGNLCAYDKKGNPYPISNFVARPMMEVTRDDGVSQRKTFRIEGLLSEGRKLPAIDVEASDFQSMNWIMNNWGISASIRGGFGRKDLCRDAIQSMATNITQYSIYTHIGWRRLDNGNWVYLHTDGCVGDENICVETEKVLERYALPKTVTDTISASHASLSLLDIAPNEITIPLLALVYLSPLVEPFKLVGLEPNFVMWLHGHTGSRKTSLALLFLAHFGGFHSRTPPASFKDTVNAIERRAFSTKDSLLVIDDYHPEASKYEASKMEQTAQKILRMYGDRVARGRLNSSIQFQKEYPPRGMALITGEDLPSGESSVARFIGIELTTNSVDLDRLTEAQSNGYLLSQAMLGYIQWLIPQMDDLPKSLEIRFKVLRAQFQQKCNHGRIGESAAWLEIGYERMLTYMTEVGAINEEEANARIKECEAKLLFLIDKQGGLIKQSEPAELFINILSEMLSSNKVVTYKITHDTPSELDCGAGNKIGWMDNEFYYLLPEVTYYEVSKFLQGRGEVFPVSERTLWKHLNEQKMIKVEIGGGGKVQRCIKKIIHYKHGHTERPRLLHLYRNILDGKSTQE